MLHLGNDFCRSAGPETDFRPSDAWPETDREGLYRRKASIFNRVTEIYL
jgi:hypothetical protein